MFGSIRPLRSGLSLLEVMVTLTILAVIAGAVAQVAFSGNGNRQAVAWSARNTVEQVRELALRHNCNATVIFSSDFVSIRLFRDDHSPVESTQLQAIIGGSAKSISSVNLKLSDLLNTTAGATGKVVDSKGKNVGEVEFNFQGVVVGSSDLTMQIDGPSFRPTIEIEVSRLTGLIRTL